MASEEFKKYCDNIWIDAIYREFGEDTSQTGTRALETGALMPYNTLIHTKTPDVKLKRIFASYYFYFAYNKCSKK